MRLEFHVWGENSDIKAGLGMMGSEWQAMDGAARQGKRKSKGGFWLWKTPRERERENKKAPTQAQG